MLRLLFHSDFKLKAEDDNANANRAIEADADKADVTDKADEAFEADEADKTDEADAAKADKADLTNEAGNKLGELLMAVIVLILVFSLTKYSVIFTEVEGDFAKNINNQLK